MAAVQEDRAATGSAARLHRPVVEGDDVAPELDFSAGLARSAVRGVHAAGDIHGAALACADRDVAAHDGAALRDGHAVHVARDEAGLGRGDAPAVAHAGPGDDTRLRDRGRCADENIPARLADIDAAPGSERDGAFVRSDAALVAHVGAIQGDVIHRHDAPAIFHRAGEAGEIDTPGEEIGIRDVSGGGDETADIHDRAVAKINPVRICEHDPAVGGERAEDLRGVRGRDAVERHGERARLDEVHAFTAGDAEALVVDDGAVAGLDVQGAAGLAEGRCARLHLRALRQRVERGGERDPGEDCRDGFGEEKFRFHGCVSRRVAVDFTKQWWRRRGCGCRPR